VHSANPPSHDDPVVCVNVKPHVSRQLLSGPARWDRSISRNSPFTRPGYVPTRVFRETGDVITAADEYPLHQSSRPFRDPGTDRNLYDRFFFCGYPTDDTFGPASFHIAFGQYPGRNVMDGAFSLVRNGRQRNVRGSRLLGSDRLDLHVGPLRVEIVEPLRQLRVLVDAPEAGLAASLLFTSRGPAFEEPHYRFASGQLTTFDITRLTQNGTWSGWIKHDGERIEVTAPTWQGTRDRSWGIRGVGGREPNLAPDGPPPAFYWLWAPLNFPDANLLFDVNETPAGTRWHENAQLAPVGGDPIALAQDVREGMHTYDITWKSGTRHAAAFAMTLTHGDEKRTVRLETLNTFFMPGIGYMHPTWGHGMFVGPNEQTHDEYVTADVNEADLAWQHVQHLVKATRSDGVVGHGLLEMLIIGAHGPSGFTDYTDMHA
jgi:hypothetical protein